MNVELEFCERTKQFVVGITGKDFITNTAIKRVSFTFNSIGEIYDFIELFNDAIKRKGSEMK